MLLNEEDLQERLNSPLNLLNRLRNVTTPTGIPCLPPTSSDLGLDKDIESKLAVGKLRETAAGVMATALAELKVRIGDVSRPKDLANIAESMNKIVQSRENENKIPPQIIVYAPQVIQENHFEELRLNEDIVSQ